MRAIQWGTKNRRRRHDYLIKNNDTDTRNNAEVVSRHAVIAASRCYDEANFRWQTRPSDYREECRVAVVQIHILSFGGKERKKGKSLFRCVPAAWKCISTAHKRISFSFIHERGNKEEEEEQSSQVCKLGPRLAWLALRSLLWSPYLHRLQCGLRFISHRG